MDSVLDSLALPLRFPVHSFPIFASFSDMLIPDRLEEGLELDNEEITGVLTGRRV